MTRSKSSHRWLREHFNDPYVKASQRSGYRSRASYKLIELDDKDRLIKPGATIVDLGAAPGGWSQVASERLKGQGKVIASDILPMDNLEGVEFLQGDFTEESVYLQLEALLDGKPADLVISDMAPNMSGVKSVDQTQSIYLCELALDLAGKVLKPKGAFVCKVFHGEGFDNFFKTAKGLFKTVITRKPGASRARSREVYLVAKGLK